MRYIKCFFKSVTSNKSGVTYYMYSQTPSFQCNVKIGKTTRTFPVTLDSGGSSDPLTMWLGNSNEMSADEAKLLAKEMGGTSGYFAIDADNNIDFVAQLPKSASVVTSIFA